MGKPRGGKKRKTELVFDEQKRREFLGGFRKRKQERRKKAKDELEKKVKEDRKRIKQELKDGFQEQFKKSFEPIELEGELKEEEYDTENVTVQIVELSTDELAKTNNWIGANKPRYEDEQSSGAEQNDSGVDESEEEDVPGFTVTVRKPKKRPIAADVENVEEPKETVVKKKTKKLREDFKSKRAMGQYLAKQAQNTLQHSKAYQTKNRLERIRNMKKARIEKEKRIKLQNKREKHKKNSAKPSKPPKASKFSKKGKGPGKGPRK